jgi:hypothetical protein
MKHYTFRTSVDSELKHKESEIEFAFLVTVFLNDPNGWNARGYTFTYSEKDPDIVIRLSTPLTIVSKCGLPKNLSCAEMHGKNVYLNSDRWFSGAPKSKLSLENYRSYMVLHEVGHILGFEHETCPCAGCPAPIMMQQTLGIGKCNPNTKITNKHG